MPGFCVLEGTTICVDKFRTKKTNEPTHFFCTHAHADHTDGLTGSWDHSLIYCTEQTAKVLAHKFKLKRNRFFILPFKERVRLKIARHRNALPEPKNADPFFTVTCFPANHCLGACMFLFEGYFGKFLYTGDFRGHESLHFPEFIGVDRLYFDNTYLATSHENHLQLTEAVEEILSLLEKHEGFDVIIGMDYIGKEEILIEISKRLKRLICIEPDRYLMLQTMMPNLHQIFTKDEKKTNIRVSAKRHLTLKRLDELNLETPTFGLIMTGWRKPIKRSMDGSKIYCVPYSIHSSCAELRAFVKHVRPCTLIPMMKCSADLLKTKLGAYVSDREPHNFEMPESVRNVLKNRPKPRPTLSSVFLRPKKQKRKEAKFQENYLSPKRGAPRKRLRHLRFSPSDRAVKKIMRSLRASNEIIDLTQTQIIDLT